MIHKLTWKVDIDLKGRQEVILKSYCIERGGLEGVVT